MTYRPQSCNSQLWYKVDTDTLKLKIIHKQNKDHLFFKQFLTNTILLYTLTLNENKGNVPPIALGIFRKVDDWEVPSRSTQYQFCVTTVLGKRANSKITTIQAADVFVDQHIDFSITQNKDQSAQNQ